MKVTWGHRNSRVAKNLWGTSSNFNNPPHLSVPSTAFFIPGIFLTSWNARVFFSLNFFIRSELTLVSQSVTQLQTADFKLLHIHVEPSPPAFFRRHICLISRSKFCYYDCVKEFLITRIYKHVSWGESLLQLFRSRLRRQQVPSRYYYGKIFVFLFGFDSVEFAKFSHVKVFAS